MHTSEYIAAAAAAVGILNLLINVIGGLIAATKGMHAIDIKIETKASILREELAAGLHALRKEFQESQMVQEDAFREVGTGLRKFIELTNDKIREMEIWGRDHYVQQNHFERSIDSINSSVREGFATLRADFMALKKEIRDDMRTHHKPPVQES